MINSSNRQHQLHCTIAHDVNHIERMVGMDRSAKSGIISQQIRSFVQQSVFSFLSLFSHLQQKNIRKLPRFLLKAKSVCFCKGELNDGHGQPMGKICQRITMRFEPVDIIRRGC
ncbi:hypothetical protein TNCT_467561 [Trichonephila clavata]|uniref:Uncharacterized protein n=1 Tax=Trichonephila clavata TaxID=2740835 RepID=A0A8X6JVW7_TRICU|nr:hypothetical protein TNCT_467561 [Trichonephila clavata]